MPAQVPPDSLLQRRLQRVFANIEKFEQVRVQVQEGVVSLTGSTVRGEHRDQAEELASRFDGVVYVNNQIEDPSGVETRVTPAVQRIQDYWSGIIANLPVIAVALAVFIFFLMLSSLIGRWKTPFAWLGVSELLQNLIRRLVRTVLVLIGIILALDILDITALVGAGLGAAGVVGLALGFAFQDIVENYLAGLLLSLRHPFKINDLVQIGEHEGKVIRLTSRELLLMTLEGNHVRLPNATVFKSVLINYTINPRRRFDFSVGMGVDENLKAAIDVGLNRLQAMPGVMEDPAPFARVEELGDSTVAVRFFGWVDQQEADYYKVRSEAIRLVKTALDDAGVEMPEPIYRVVLQEMPPAEETAEAPAPSDEIEAVDVSIDNEVEKQVREDIATSGEANLLTQDE